MIAADQLADLAAALLALVLVALVLVALVVFGCIGSVYSVPSELECTNLADESPTLTEIKACLAVD
jgi:hypothetical protein